MANHIDNRTKIQDIIFAEVTSGGALIISSGIFGSDDPEDEYQTEMIIGQEGVKALRELLVRDAQLRIGADDAGQGKTCRNCGSNDFIIRYGIEQCEDCGYAV